MMIVLGVRMFAMMMVVIGTSHQQQRAHDVDQEAQYRNQRGIAEIDAHRVDQSGDGFARDTERENAEDQRRCEAGQVANLAGAETEFGIIAVFFGIAIGGRRKAESTGMGRHVEAIGEKGHRAGDVTGNDFGDHHHGRKTDYPERSLGVSIMGCAQEDVIMCRIFGVCRSGHAVSPIWNIDG